ncbi:TPA_asm: US2.6 [Human alphaherpesvirus 1]|nr:TPA_asm: US2.6 [Human alphaherpesvirus 1]
MQVQEGQDRRVVQSPQQSRLVARARVPPRLHDYPLGVIWMAAVKDTPLRSWGERSVDRKAHASHQLGHGRGGLAAAADGSSRLPVHGVQLFRGKSRGPNLIPAASSYTGGRCATRGRDVVVGPDKGTGRVPGQKKLLCVFLRIGHVVRGVLVDIVRGIRAGVVLYGVVLVSVHLGKDLLQMTQALGLAGWCGVGRFGGLRGRGVQARVLGWGIKGAMRKHPGRLCLRRDGLLLPPALSPVNATKLTTGHSPHRECQPTSTPNDGPRGFKERQFDDPPPDLPPRKSPSPPPDASAAGRSKGPPGKAGLWTVGPLNF